MSLEESAAKFRATLCHFQSTDVYDDNKTRSKPPRESSQVFHPGAIRLVTAFESLRFVAPIIRSPFRFYDGT